jgi:hypothetical protein
VVDEEIRLVAANKKASRLLGKKVAKIKGMHFGEAIECPYARLPGGCGQAVHCRSCTVRLTTQDTYITGQSHYDIPAYQDICFADEEKKICFLISTEKSGDFVFVKINEVNEKVSKQVAPRNKFDKRLSSAT